MSDDLTIEPTIAYTVADRWFVTKAAAERWVEMKRRAMSIGALLPDRVPDHLYAGYYQHDADTFRDFSDQLLEAMREDSKALDMACKEVGAQSAADVDPSGVSAMYDGTDELSKLWFRVMCTDDEFREWQQPFYRENPDSRDYTCQNPDQETD